MLAEMTIGPWHWAGFVFCILVFLAVDLGLFHREAHQVPFKEGLFWSGVWFTVAMLFGFALLKFRGREDAAQFVTGYIIELSLSMDNVFVIALIFAYFRIPAQYQHRVLFWGILGALLMRGLLIGLGAALVARFHAILYVFGAFLLVTGVRMMFGGDEGVHPEKNPMIRLARKFFPVSAEFDGHKFQTLLNGRRALTPLALVLLTVETTDLIFALDSIPAIFAVTQDTFIVFTSNVFAILGLRSLYFVLAGAIRYFRFLKVGLSLVLIFIGVKMLVVKWVSISTTTSLGVVAGIILISIATSAFISKHPPRT